MTTLQLFVLAVVQGITEFLPISSSGHLALVPVLTGWPDQGPMMDIAVHVGTLLAVMGYFRRDLWAMVLGLVAVLRGRPDAGSALLGLIALATLPVVLAGLVINLMGWSEALRTVEVLGWTIFGFGIVLYLADRFGTDRRAVADLNWRHAVMVGLAQALALIPGTSRAGITISAARALGYRRDDAARISMLLSIPTIAAAGLLIGFDLWRLGDATVGREALTAAALAFATALLAIWGLMRWLRTASYTVFVVYRLVLGAILLGFAYDVF